MTVVALPLIISTTPSVEGRTITKHAGIVGVVDGREQTSPETLKEMRESAFQNMQSQAEAIGADAVVGLSVNYTYMGVSEAGRPMLLLSFSGTAVKLA